MNKRRLLKLADLLEADAKNKNGVKFDLGGWGHSIGREAPVSVSCGTTACAMGLAVLSGAFEKDGLRNNFGPEARSIVPELIATGRRRKRLCGFEAVDALFDLTDKQSSWLFIDESYPPSKRAGARGERAVAKRIRAFVAGEARP